MAFGPNAITLNDMTARVENGERVMLPIIILMGVAIVLLIVWAKRHRRA